MAALIPCDSCDEENALLLVSDVNTGASYGIGPGCLVGWCVATITMVDPEAGEKIGAALNPAPPEKPAKAPTKAAGATKRGGKGADSPPPDPPTSDDDTNATDEPAEGEPVMA